MNDIYDRHSRTPEPELIAIFGAARLVWQADGRIELVGGTPEDRDQARAWAALFLQTPGPQETRRAWPVHFRRDVCATTRPAPPDSP